MKRRIFTIAVLATLAACGPGEKEPEPPRVSAGEAEAIDDAAAMLDEQRSPSADGTRVPAPLPPDPDASTAPAVN